MCQIYIIYYMLCPGPFKVPRYTSSWYQPTYQQVTGELSAFLKIINISVCWSCSTVEDNLPLHNSIIYYISPFIWPRTTIKFIKLQTRPGPTQKKERGRRAEEDTWDCRNNTDNDRHLQTKYRLNYRLYSKITKSGRLPKKVLGEFQSGTRLCYQKDSRLVMV